MNNFAKLKLLYFPTLDVHSNHCYNELPRVEVSTHARVFLLSVGYVAGHLFTILVCPLSNRTDRTPYPLRNLDV